MGALLPLRGAFPWLIWMGQHVPFFPWFKNVGITRQRVVQYGQERTARYMELVNSEDTAVKKTLFSSLVRKSNGVNGEFSSQEVAAESQSYITAGTDTTAITMTYLIYTVISNEDIRKNLLEELQALPEHFAHRDLRALPYLNLVLEETLRLHGASQGGLPRVVPRSGASLAGYFIPGGTIVSTQNYSMHRDKDAFPDPEK